MLLKVAVIDDHDSYRERFVATLADAYADKLEVSSFSSIETFDADQAKSEPVDIMLVSASLASDQIDSRNGALTVYLVDDRSIERLYDKPAVCRYQKVDLIYRALLDAALDLFDAVTFRGEPVEGAAIVSFFPACGGAGASTLAAACALGAARRGWRTFYLNLELYGQAGMYFDADGFGSLSDAIFAVLAKKHNINMRIQSMTKHTEQGVAFLDSCRTPLDLIDLTPDSTVQLLHGIAASSPYDIIVVDADYPHSPIAPTLMELSMRNVFVSNGSEVSNDKLACVVDVLHGRDSRTGFTHGLDNAVLVYNNFDEATSSYLASDDLTVLGSIDHYANTTTEQLVDLIANSSVIDELLNIETPEDEDGR